MTFESYSRPSRILHNKLDTDDPDFLQKQETASSSYRITEIESGNGPKGNFDVEHLKAVHGHIFQDVYPWAGHMRNETFKADGQEYGPIEGMSKQGGEFLRASRMGFGLSNALEPIADRAALKAGTTEEFAEKAGETLGRLNYVHPFREGNGRSQRALMVMLGQETGREVDFSVITEGRNYAASVAVFKNPENPAFKDMILDATDPARREALQVALKDLQAYNKDPNEFNIRTAKVGETLEGGVFHLDSKHLASVVTGKELVVINQSDLPQNTRDSVSIEVKTSLSENSATKERSTGKAKQRNQDDDYGR